VRREEQTQRPSTSRACGGPRPAAASPARRRAGKHTAADTGPLSSARERRRPGASARGSTPLLPQGPFPSEKGTCASVRAQAPEQNGKGRARAGAGGAAGVPQLHRHGLLPAPAPVPARAAAAPERALQGARSRATRRAPAGVLACGRPRLPTHSLDCARKCTC